MHRYTRYSDYYPTPHRYQYRYFYPMPVLPATRGVELPKTHSCGLHAHDHKDHGCHVWNKIGARCATLESEKAAVREHALKKVLPWRAAPEKDVLEDTSFYTGRGITYNGSADIFDTPLIDKFPNLVTASNICSSHASRSYTYPGAKYSPEEWRISNQQLCSGAECVHNTSIMVRSDANNCVETTDKEQVRCHTDTNKDIDNRVHDIKRWTDNLQDELKYNISQTHEMMELKERLEMMIKNIEKPLEIAQDNLMTRETRQGVELVRDTVEESLFKEVETLRKNEEKLLEEMDRLNSYMTRLRAARHEIELDIRNKELARKTDECVKALHTLSSEIGHVDSISHAVLATSSPTSWIQNTQAIIHRSQEERNNCQVLNAEISRSMVQCADECFSTWYATNSSFNTRICETTNAKQSIEKQLQRIKVDIDNLSRHMIEVRKAVDEKRPLLKLAQARLEKRKQRPAMELCRDKAMIALVNEVRILKTAIDQLTTKLDQMDTTMSQLMKTKGTLEHDCKLKEVALFIDREKCLSLRLNYPISTFKETRYPKKVGSSESRILR